MKHIIHIFGASGSGTTTLARALHDALGLTHLDTDDYFWLPTDPPFTQKRPVPERLSMMEQDIDASTGAVISGSLTDWGDVLIPRFTLAIRMVTDTAVRLERLHAREYARFGSRILPGGDMHSEHLAFLDWASRYDTGSLEMRSRAKHDAWQQLLSCPLITLCGSDPLDQLVQHVQDALPQCLTK